MPNMSTHSRAVSQVAENMRSSWATGASATCVSVGAVAHLSDLPRPTFTPRLPLSRYRDASADAERAVEVDPSYAKGLYRLAVCQKELCDLAGAWESATRAPWHASCYEFGPPVVQPKLLQNHNNVDDFDFAFCKPLLFPLLLLPLLLQIASALRCMHYSFRNHPS